MNMNADHKHYGAHALEKGHLHVLTHSEHAQTPNPHSCYERPTKHTLLPFLPLLSHTTRRGACGTEKAAVRCATVRACAMIILADARALARIATGLPCSQARTRRCPQASPAFSPERTKGGRRRSLNRSHTSINNWVRRLSFPRE